MENSVMEARWLILPVFGLCAFVTVVGFIAG
jgi:hypothetical protein